MGGAPPPPPNPHGTHKTHKLEGVPVGKLRLLGKRLLPVFVQACQRGAFLRRVDRRVAALAHGCFRYGCVRRHEHAG